MKKLFSRMVLSGMIMMVAACGSGGGDSAQVVSSDKHQLSFVRTAKGDKAAVDLVLSTQGDVAINLVKNGAPATVKLADLKEVRVNGNCIGWISQGGAGITNVFPGTAHVTGIPDVPTAQIGLFSFVDKNDEEYFINTDFIELVNSNIPVVIENGLIRWGDAVANPNFSCP